MKPVLVTRLALVCASIAVAIPNLALAQASPPNAATPRPKGNTQTPQYLIAIIALPSGNNGSTITPLKNSANNGQKNGPAPVAAPTKRGE